ncbi:hypothetical protein SRABI118_04825 [Massilia sp. Bi118]|jgi:uncharacterized membrane protein YgcG|uniref:hypothetical protein n=1 Tax=Massilia sp. Bi118 TaxID=2822346 RepID=UPI001D34A137|nr:hypothetical protein [Massilia sp. Bi118]CAH0311854.1 hypothetical protein SRABI118_04825 [Massilia sp. Bi118]
MNKYFFYALFVTIVTTFACWVSMINTASGSGRSGSSWSSGSHGTGSYGGGYSGGGGHK